MVWLEMSSNLLDFYDNQFIFGGYKKTMNEHHISCACYSPEHSLTWTYEKGEEEIYLTFHLNFKPFLWRLLNAIKYVLGCRCQYGHFDEVILGVDDRNELIEFLQQTKPDNE